MIEEFKKREDSLIKDLEEKQKELDKLRSDNQNALEKGSTGT